MQQYVLRDKGNQINTSLFRHALDTSNNDWPDPSTTRELWMMMAGNLIRDKPDWWKKIEDDGIWGKWMDELTSQYDNNGDVVSEKMKEYIRAECRFIAKNMDHTLGIVDALNNTFKSDCLIPQELKIELKNSVSVLENVPDKLKDWHPGSDNKVLDLVHPSLYPIVYGRSRSLSHEAREVARAAKRCLPHSASGLLLEAPKWKARSIWSFDAMSSNFQWLPSEFSVDPETKKCRFTSYINNLHPLYHKQLYYTLEKILTRCFPIAESVLASLRAPNIKRTEEPKPWDWYEDFMPPEGISIQERGDLLEKYYENRRPIMPEALEFNRKERMKPAWKEGATEGLGTYSDLNHGQVIVKLANIELTPEKPEYEGGGWHLEGHLNERIVTTVIYYYSSENITDNHLSFRQLTDEPGYEQGDNLGVRMVYGLVDEQGLNQSLGYIVTKEDRVIAFPNIYQHKVSPFKLLDPAKPGHRKIVCFFFVDPHCKVTSTADVAPQQFDWWKEEVHRIQRFRSLPGEIFENVMDFVEWPMKMNEAKQVRLELMEERGVLARTANEEIFEREFSLCEH